MAAPKKASISKVITISHWNGGTISFHLDDVYIQDGHVFNKYTDRNIAFIEVNEREEILELMKA
ncbi:hypothetical protein HOU12_gp08 [Dickeya phage Katbat]|uniref:Uncharacterized protein n=1 Tax=Dickeya phage Katbat TaxID=2320191 RepID=A0A385IFV3_9CAUD|nr:hypothetical protein HOU12_gp08 [Dickeya phage Katbat]AXY81725.1 hypothetical protein [Dickeya phage Katbat]